MHYICIITVIYIMYTNVSMLIYVIEPKNTGERGKIVRLPKWHWRRCKTRDVLYILTHRDDLVVASATKSSTRTIRIFYIYNRSNLCGHIRFLNVLQYSVIQTRVPEKEQGKNWLKTDLLKNALANDYWDSFSDSGPSGTFINRKTLSAHKLSSV